MLPRTTIVAKNTVAVVMMAALMLLVTGNFWISGAQKAKQAAMAAASTTGDEESGNAPDAPNPTEEKTSGGMQTISEYLHDHLHLIHHPVVLISAGYGHEFDQLPVHHPEQHTPPPKQA